MSMLEQVESALRMQRESWREIVARVTTINNRELSPEPPKRILLFGVGSSHFAARLTAHTLFRDRTRTRVPVIACSSLAIGGEVVPVRGDWAFAFSHRGATQPTLSALEACDRAGAFTVLVCGQGVADGAAGTPASVRFVLPTVPLETCEPHTISVSGAVCAVTTMLLGTKAAEEWDALQAIGDPPLDYLKSQLGKAPTVLIGEWEGEWLAREGALKLMEMARAPVRSFGTEEFFHGPKSSLAKGDRVWHLSLSRDPRNADVALMTKEWGAGSVREIRVSESTPLAWIPALLEIQWSALAVAQNSS